MPDAMVDEELIGGQIHPEILPDADTTTSDIATHTGTMLETIGTLEFGSNDHGRLCEVTSK